MNIPFHHENLSLVTRRSPPPVNVWPRETNQTPLPGLGTGLIGGWIPGEMERFLKYGKVLLIILLVCAAFFALKLWPRSGLSWVLTLDYYTCVAIPTPKLINIFNIFNIHLLVPFVSTLYRCYVFFFPIIPRDCGSAL